MVLSDITVLMVAVKEVTVFPLVIMILNKMYNIKVYHATNCLSSSVKE